MRASKQKTTRRRIFELLGRPSSAAHQFRRTTGDNVGEWIYSRLKPLSSTTFYKHLRGENTVSVAPIRQVNGRPCASFLCWDIDEHFRERLPVMHDVLKERGMAAAAWAASGSDSGRGKVIVSFSNPMPQCDAVKLVKDVLGQAQASLFWREEVKKTSCYPTNRGGAHVRILGRNQARTELGHLDYPLDIAGNPSDLSHVTPFEVPDLPTMHTRIYGGINSSTSTPTLDARAAMLRNTAYVGSGSTIFADMGYLAKAAIRQFGKDDSARSFFVQWCDELQNQIPSEKKQTLRQVNDEGTRQRAWTGACIHMTYGVGVGADAYRGDKLGNWRPLDPANYRRSDLQKPTKSAWRVYNSLAQYVVHFRNNPHCFGLTYGRVAQLCESDDKATIRKYIDRAECAGMLFRLDRGESKVGGLWTLYTLVGDRQTLQEAYDLGIGAEDYKQRLQDRITRGLLPSRGYVVENRPYFPVIPLPIAA